MSASPTTTAASPRSAAHPPHAPARITESTTAAVRAAAVAVAQELPEDDSRWQTATHTAVRALLRRLIAARGHRVPALLRHLLPEQAEQLLDGIGPFAGWTVYDIGDIHQNLLRLHLTTRDGQLIAELPRGTTARDVQGAWYTPEPLAREATRLALTPALKHAAPGDPEEILRINALDPACGAGVFLVEAARTLARAYAARHVEGEPPQGLVELVLPMVTFECVYGIDIDPVAVDLAKTALWLEAGAKVPFGWLDGNIACLDPLADPNNLPARLRGVLGEPPKENAR